MAVKTKKYIIFSKFNGKNELQELWEIVNGEWVRVKDLSGYRKNQFDNTRYTLIHYPPAKKGELPTLVNLDHGLFTLETQLTPGEKPLPQIGEWMAELFLNHLARVDPNLAKEVVVEICYIPLAAIGQIKDIPDGWSELFVNDPYLRRINRPE